MAASSTGTYYFRRTIPEGLRERAGKREFKRSLRTSDARDARKRYPAWFTADTAQFAEADVWRVR